tara:strand:- start:225 stop:773 length:549 start_codon:yes stop_codon:yes gene_type:complete
MALTRLGLNQAINLATNTTGTLAVANGGTGLTSGFVNGVANPGKINQVLQSEDNTQTTISSTSYGSISLSQAITPSATSSKVLVMGYVKYSIGTTNTDRGFGLRIRRDSTAIQTSTTLYDKYHKSTNSDFIDGGRHSFMYIDSPSSTSAITYSVRIGCWNNLSITINNDGNYSQIQCWEILA